VAVLVNRVWPLIAPQNKAPYKFCSCIIVPEVEWGLLWCCTGVVRGHDFRRGLQRQDDMRGRDGSGTVVVLSRGTKHGSLWCCTVLVVGWRRRRSASEGMAVHWASMW
jgi:hypothetical protein